MKNLIYIVILIPLICFGQKQGNIWYFGHHAGLDFNHNPPIVLTDGQTYVDLEAQEGCATISDTSGNLLFYTNGEKVWNRLHQVMPNGDTLLGHRSSTQAAIIVPKPLSDHFFYIFTTDAFVNNFQNGLRYSIVDICDENGLGNVVKDQKNLLLLDTASEKLTVTQHSNGIDYWIVCAKHFSNQYYAFLLTSTGISDTVVSHFGPVHQSGYASSFGQMKISPDGSKMAMVIGQGGDPSNCAVLFDFNNNTGVIDNSQILPTNNHLYGVAFSPDNTKLYITEHFGNTRLNQFDLSNGNSQTIIDSSYSAYGMQLGPNGKIYVARSTNDTHYLSVINNPNFVGVACNYLQNAIYLNSGTCSYTFPGFIDNFQYPNLQNTCITNNIKTYTCNLINIFPNPTNDYVVIKNEKLKIKNVAVYDIYGKEVLSQITNFKYQNTNIDLSPLPQGIYIIRVTTDKQAITKKVIKQ